jgi:hypothetical protein
VREFGPRFEESRNSRADRKSARQEFFYGVTTRPFPNGATRRRPLVLLSPTPFPLRPGMVLTTFGGRPPFPLPFGRLPSP